MRLLESLELGCTTSMSGSQHTCLILPPTTVQSGHGHPLCDDKDWYEQNKDFRQASLPGACGLEVILCAGKVLSASLQQTDAPGAAEHHAACSQSTSHMHMKALQFCDC